MGPSLGELELVPTPAPRKGSILLRYIGLGLSVRFSEYMAKLKSVGWLLAMLLAALSLNSFLTLIAAERSDVTGPDFNEKSSGVGFTLQ